MMNITRSEKMILSLVTVILLLIISNSITGYYLYKEYSQFLMDTDSSQRHEMVVSRYTSDVYAKPLNEDFYEYLRPDGSTALALKDGSYVFYGSNLNVDKVLWGESGFVEEIHNVYSNTSQKAIYDGYKDEIVLSNFGTLDNPKTYSDAKYREKKEILQQDYANRLSQLSEHENRQNLAIASKSNSASQRLNDSNENSKFAPQKELTIESKSSVKDTASLLPGADCSIHYCKEGDLPAYPLPIKALKSIAALPKTDQLPFFTVGNTRNGVDLTVIWDVDCPKCAKFYRDVLNPLIKDGKSVRFLVSTNEAYDDIPPSKWNKMAQLLCDVEPIQIIKKDKLNLPYLPQPKSECGISTIQPKVKALKQTLAQFGLNGPTPVSFARKGMLYGAIFNLEETKRYIAQ
ncbi:hypothetical protein HUO05_24745 (plasmid) [Vibrio alginolyticus]|uniref:hypothetical protein n=1 Tax=Vibrio alginolyticus TaxID=663 RepID=UPI001593CD06|nr:hypothetical protein [Vibrio alginolyticus]QKS98415.1 hypothetical protein HUO05_24745 [Vibrio alginolyticus]